MPLYEYSCTKCHQDLEIMQKLAETPLKKCPSCGGKLVKNLSATSFQLKGGGWYKDGYSSAASKPDATAKSDAGKTESSKSESTKADSAKTDSVKTDSAKSDSVKPAKEKN